MKAFFEPESVAVVGASTDPEKGGHIILQNLKQCFDGPIYPVNPRAEEILGLPCYSSISEVPGEVDLAIILIPAEYVSDVVRECAENDVRAILLESGGFAEAGRHDLQREVVRIAREAGMRVWGPNCTGIVSRDITTMFLPLPEMDWGNTGIIAQSGMLTAGLLFDAIEGGWQSISRVCSIGNKADVDECDVLEYLLQDTETDVICLYTEGSLDGRRFMRITRGAEKPIIVFAAGETEEARRAAESHTASMAGNYRVLSAALRQAGCLQVWDFHELLETAKPFSMYATQAKPAGNNLAVVTITGAGGVVASDIAARNGLKLAQLAEETTESLQELFPSWMPPQNPVDYWPTVELRGINRAVRGCLRAVLADPNVDCAVVTVGPFWKADDLDPCIIPRLAKEHGKPVSVWLSGEQRQKHRWGEKIEKHGTPVYYSLEAAVESLAKYVLYYSRDSDFTA